MTLVQVSPVGPPDPFDELTLVERARTDRDAFAELYRLYLPRIYTFAYRRCGSRPLAEDVTAATFEEALRSLPPSWPKVAGSAPGCSGSPPRDRRPLPGRRAGPGPGGPPGLTLLAVPSIDEDGIPLPGGGEDHGRLLAALGTLNPRYQKAISLRYLAGLSHAEAAEAMGTTKPVMAVTLHRALRALRRVLDVPECASMEPAEVDR